MRAADSGSAGNGAVTGGDSPGETCLLGGDCSSSEVPIIPSGGCDGGTCEEVPPSDPCGDLPLPPSVTPLRPLRGAYTGSLHAPASAATLRPELVWSASDTSCGPLTYHVMMDDNCSAGALDACTFPSPEVDARVAQPSFQPATALPVASTAPVGALYSWRVRACDAGERCSSWSSVAYLHVGRTPQDINGDGFADVIAEGVTGDVHLGNANFDSRADEQLSLTSSTGSRFVGDLNADGFGDLAILEADFQVCSSSGYYPTVVFGNSNLQQLQRQALCAVAGSPSVVFGLGHVGDLNGDGFDDLAFARELGSASSFRVLLGGNAVRSTAEIDLDVSIPGEVAGSAADYPHTSGKQTFDGGGDFNGDGFADVIMSGDGRRATGLVRQRLYLGGGTLARSSAGTLDITGCFNPWLTRLGDLNRDARDDWGLVCSSSTGNGSRFEMIAGAPALPSAPSDGFDSATPLGALTRGIDFDSDGSLEVVLTGQAGGGFIWQLGSSQPTPSSIAIGGRVATADHNGDARPDVLSWMVDRQPAWSPGGASFIVTPLNLLPLTGDATPAGVMF